MRKTEQLKLPKALNKRIIKPENYTLFMTELSRKPFECFSGFTKKLKILGNDLAKLIHKHECLNEGEFIDKKEAELNSEYDSLAEDMKNISKSMKDKHPDQYKKLTARIFDTNKKSEKFQSVKIKKALIEEIQRESKPEWRNIQIEKLLENILDDYIKINMKKFTKPEPKKPIKKPTKKNSIGA